MPLPNPNYTINFTDPTKAAFVIPAFRTDGPTGPATPVLDVDATAAHTSLLLYGKGHPNYGERTDQNLVNMIEHFANKTRPVFPIEGQIWFKNSSFTDPTNPIDPLNAGLYVFSPLNFTILSADGATHFVLAPSTLALGQNILDIANYFSTGNTFVVFGTSSNNGTYNVVAAIPVGANIQITVASVPAFQGVGGNAQASKWNTIQLSGAPVGDLDMGGFKIINLGAPTNPNDATNKAYVDTQDALHVLKAGDTITGLIVFSVTAGIQFTGTGQIDMGTNKIINLGNPTLNQDAATKSYTDSQDALHVLKTGDTMSGPLDMGGNKITSLGNATVGTDALNRQTGDGRYLQLTGGTLTGTLNFVGAIGTAINVGLNQIKNMADPTIAQDAATKAYVDLVAGGGSDTYVSSFTYSGGLASTSTLNLTQTGPNAGVPFIINMAHDHSTDDSEFVVPSDSDLDLYYRLFGASGYQRVTFTAPPITNAGLPYGSNATRTATITIDGIAFPISVTVVAFGTYTFSDLTNDINSQLGTAGVIRIIDGDSFLSVVSKSTSPTSTVLIADVNLFSTITNFLAITAAVPGYGAALVTGYPTISLTDALIGYDTVKVSVRPVEVLSSFTLNPRTTNPITSGAAQAQVDIPIITATSSAFTIKGGDFTPSLTPGVTFDINENTLNTGTYTVLSSTFDDSNQVTTVNVVQTIPSPFSTPDGSTISYAFVPESNSDILTKFWSDTLVARDIQTSSGTTTFTLRGGFQDAWLTGTITGASATGLSNTLTVYTASVFIDGVLNLIAVTGSAAQTYTTLLTEINADLTGAIATLENSGIANSGKIRIKSTSTGRTSTVSITDTTPNLLFDSLTAFDTFGFPRPGLDYLKGLNRLWVFVNGIKQFLDDDYYEDGGYATRQTTITFSYSVPLGARVEFTVFNT